MSDRPEASPGAASAAITLESAEGRWVLAGSVLGSGAAFLETSVVTVALPAIGRDLNLGIAGLQWVTNGYLLTLSALMLLGGALGDRFRRSHVFAVGLVGFASACACCALAPNAIVLVACRVLQGVFGALLVPNSLAMLETTFAGEGRGVAIGHWSAWSAVSTALGPLVGGWVVDRGSWRWAFASMVPFAVIAAWIAVRHGRVADHPAATRPVAVRADRGRGGIDYVGAVLATAGLAGIVAALTLAATRGPLSRPVLALGTAGIVALVACAVVEGRSAHPLLPLRIFRSSVFTGANVVTLLVYAALGGLFFMLMLELQDVLGYSALEAGASLLPVNVLMLLISPAAGRTGQRIGPRLPITVGALVAAGGMVLFARVGPGASYVTTVLPAVLVFGIGLSVLVAPLTTAVLGALEDQLAGVASGVNNAVARLGSLLATAGLPLLAGVGGSALARHSAFAAGFARAMWINAAVCAVGGVVAWLIVPRDSAGLSPS